MKIDITYDLVEFEDGTYGVRRSYIETTPIYNDCRGLYPSVTSLWTTVKTPCTDFSSADCRNTWWGEPSNIHQLCKFSNKEKAKARLKFIHDEYKTKYEVIE